jgi:hypothetical protein
MGFVVPSVMPPVPRDMSSPARISASTMSGLLLRDRFTFATARRALLQLWPQSVSSAAFVVIASSKVRLLPTSNGTVRITVSGTDIQVRVSMVSAGVTQTVSLPIAGSAIGLLTGCTPGATDTCIIEVRRITATGVLNGLWLDDLNLNASQLP